MKILKLAGMAAALALGLAYGAQAGEKEGKHSPEMKAKIEEVRKELAALKAEKAAVEKNLKTFDELDYQVFSGQQWARLHESHDKNIRVYWPDGHYTDGLEKHTEDLKAMFVYAPDTSIKVHPVRFGSGEFTGVTGRMTGTFSKPMPVGDGKVIQPTGRKFDITMATIGRWKNGVMTEEWLFWDNLTFMKQIGLAQ